MLNRIPTPTPSITSHISLKLPGGGKQPAEISFSTKGRMSAFTLAANRKLTALEAGPSSPDASGSRGAAAMAERNRLAREQRLRDEQQEAIDNDLHALEYKLSQFQCPTVVVQPAKRELSQAAAVARGPSRAERREAQRAYAEKLYQGSGVGTKLPARAGGRLPPAKLVENRLNILRADPAAREALRLDVERHIRDKAAEKIKAAGGMPKNFLAQNVVAAARRRPRSAPVARSSSPPRYLPDGTRIVYEADEDELRPAFRPGGAPAELYERPGPPPHDYLPKKLSRPQSAITRRTVVSSSALEDADDPVLVFAETSPFRAGAPENASPPSSPNKGAEAQGNPADIA